MQLRIFAVCDKGCVREHNEDAVLIDKEIFRDESKHLVANLDEKKKFFIAVADGLGEHNAGEIASEMVLQRMMQKIELLEDNLPQDKIAEKINLWVKEIHQEILDEGTRDITRRGMGSTLIGVLIYEGNIYYLNVGDSRLYRYRRGNLMQISKDHSLKEAMGDAKIPSNFLINSFGGGEKIFVEFAPVGGKIFDGDVLLLCSDGLSGMVNDEEIEQIIGEENPLDKLLTKAKDKGGEDNISIVIVYIELN